MELASSLEQSVTGETIDTLEPVASPNSSGNLNSGFSTDGLTVLESKLCLQQQQKPESIMFLSGLQIHPLHSRVLVRFCCLILLPFVRPIFEQDVKKLEAEFVHRYRSGVRPFYVSIFNDVGLEVDVTPQVISTWNTDWHDDSMKFVNFVERDGELQILNGKMLFVWEENHRYTAS